MAYRILYVLEVTMDRWIPVAVEAGAGVYLGRMGDQLVIALTDEKPPDDGGTVLERFSMDADKVRELLK